MKIDVPDIQTQRRIALERYSVEQMAQIAENAKAFAPNTELSINESEHSCSHLFTKEQGFESPSPEIVKAYFRQFQDTFPSEAGTDQKLAELLGLGSARRIRAFKKGERTVPYAAWRKFLMMTGRIQQEIVKVWGIMK